jgi:CMP-N,N'-diacetyllegionaminic acid synthase
MAIIAETPTIVGLIPARAGSKRVPGKNIRLLNDHPLIAYTIAAALQSGIFADVVVSTDSEVYAQIAEYYGAKSPFLRPKQFAEDTSPDFEWIEYTLGHLQQAGVSYQSFSILRPTSPFRQPETIRRAWYEFLSDNSIDSLRAIEKCKQHPGKMWLVKNDGLMEPLLLQPDTAQPWHSMQYQSLPVIYVQNASLEIAWTRVVFENKTISGARIKPFFTKTYEGVDVNQPADWQLVEHLISTGQATLPSIPQSPYAALA